MRRGPWQRSFLLPRCVSVQHAISNLYEAFLSPVGKRRVRQTRAQKIPAAVRASQERFRKPRCGRGVEAGQRGLVFDEFLDRIVHRSRIEDILRKRRVWGELVDDATTGGIPQKGNVFVSRRRGSCCSYKAIFCFCKNK